MTIPGLQDKDLFAETMEAFQIMSISEEERAGTVRAFLGFIGVVEPGLGLMRPGSSDRVPEGGVSRAPAGEHDLQEGAALGPGLHARRHRYGDTPSFMSLL